MSISTHILDTSRGQPAAGIPVSLEILRHGVWTEIGSGTTNADGRLATTEALEVGDYRLTFDVAAYLGPAAFYDRIMVQFRVREPRHHHIPLLLSPFGYSTYRGS
jgi:5-hydroxyisourate hydrolase